MFANFKVLNFRILLAKYSFFWFIKTGLYFVVKWENFNFFLFRNFIRFLLRFSLYFTHRNINSCLNLHFQPFLIVFGQFQPTQKSGQFGFRVVGYDFSCFSASCRALRIFCFASSSILEINFRSYQQFSIIFFFAKQWSYFFSKIIGHFWNGN